MAAPIGDMARQTADRPFRVLVGERGVAAASCCCSSTALLSPSFLPLLPPLMLLLKLFLTLLLPPLSVEVLLAIPATEVADSWSRRSKEGSKIAAAHFRMGSVALLSLSFESGLNTPLLPSALPACLDLEYNSAEACIPRAHSQLRWEWKCGKTTVATEPGSDS
jgi:hypothetical protein